MPPPMVPLEVDLAGYGFMPLYGHRLFGSGFNAVCSDAEWRAGVTLWWASWNQVPAASLPDDDTALARLADLGRDVRTWRKLRDNALRGFVKCSDGRLYHPVLAQLAINAWDRRIRDRERKAKWRERLNLSGDGPEDGDGDGDKGRDKDGPRDRDRRRDVRAEREREMERDREREKKLEKTHTPQPPKGGGVGVAPAGGFDSRLTELLDRLGVASGPGANRRWLAQAKRNRHAHSDDDLLAVIEHAVRKARELKGQSDHQGKPLVNFASDVREFILGWRPITPAGAA